MSSSNNHLMPPGAAGSGALACVLVQANVAGLSRPPSTLDSPGICRDDSAAASNPNEMARQFGLIDPVPA
jgi:hypothetical protein